MLIVLLYLKNKLNFLVQYKGKQNKNKKNKGKNQQKNNVFSHL